MAGVGSEGQPGGAADDPCDDAGGTHGHDRESIHHRGRASSPTASRIWAQAATRSRRPRLPDSLRCEAPSPGGWPRPRAADRPGASGRGSGPASRAGGPPRAGAAGASTGRPGRAEQIGQRLPLRSGATPAHPAQKTTPDATYGRLGPAPAVESDGPALDRVDHEVRAAPWVLAEGGTHLVAAAGLDGQHDRCSSASGPPSTTKPESTRPSMNAACSSQPSCASTGRSASQRGPGAPEDDVEGHVSVLAQDYDR